MRKITFVLLLFTLPHFLYGQSEDRVITKKSFGISLNPSYSYLSEFEYLTTSLTGTYSTGRNQFEIGIVLHPYPFKFERIIGTEASHKFYLFERSNRFNPFSIVNISYINRFSVFNTDYAEYKI